MHTRHTLRHSLTTSRRGATRGTDPELSRVASRDATDAQPFATAASMVCVCAYARVCGWVGVGAGLRAHIACTCGRTLILARL